MTTTFRLMQESGVTGPTATVEVESIDAAREQARAWAAGQTGHPWDVLTVSCDDLDLCDEVEQD